MIFKAGINVVPDALRINEYRAGDVLIAVKSCGVEPVRVYYVDFDVVRLSCYLVSSGRVGLQYNAAERTVHLDDIAHIVEGSLHLLFDEVGSLAALDFNIELRQHKTGHLLGNSGRKIKALDVSCSAEPRRCVLIHHEPKLYGIIHNARRSNLHIQLFLKVLFR